MLDQDSNWVEFAGKRYKLHTGESAMDALLRGGAEIAFSCRKGSCWTCLLQATSGTPDPASQEKLTQEMRDNNLFLPCVAHDMREVVARPADLSLLFAEAFVTEKTQIGPDIWKLQLEMPENFQWQPGQYVKIRNPSGDVRSYSIASIAEEDYFLELHIRHYPGGKLSEWVARDIQAGDVVNLRGPMGECVYAEGGPQRPLLMICTGTGAAPLIGIAREALRKGHQGAIHFYHGSGTEQGLYLREQLAQLAAEHPNFLPRSIASREGENRRVVDVALETHADLHGFTLYLAGHPDPVEAARVGALAQGVALEHIHADPFESEEPYQPRDKQKIDGIVADPEIWVALGRGQKLREILTDFYTRVYEDPRLVPFFHKVTKTRAIEKQYEFLADLFTGTRKFFGHPPFNAHHWMVISDELFDYRERLFFTVVREHTFPESLIERWASLHEQFRREIVKAAPRGMYHDGVELLLEGFSVERVTVDTVCDGCMEEVRSGSLARMPRRTGELFCERCEAREVA